MNAKARLSNLNEIKGSDPYAYLPTYHDATLLTTRTQSETHQLGANLEDAVDVFLGLLTFGLTLGEAGEQAEQ